MQWDLYVLTERVVIQTLVGIWVVHTTSGTMRCSGIELNVSQAYQIGVAFFQLYMYVLRSNAYMGG